ncbi:MAG TPA: YicC family protein [Deltaproteobacteria bacterium]|nr:YicC family protein [Deltaproteobacteria bacterium]
MLKSMTGFAKIEMDYNEGRIIGEARSLNNRYLEVNIKLPRTDYPYEQRLREFVKRYIKRGKIDITVKWERTNNPYSGLKINENALKQYMELIDTLKQNFGVRGSISIDTVLNFKDIIAFEENNTVSEEALTPAFENLLIKLNEERAREGELIAADLKQRLQKITADLIAIEKRWPRSIQNHEKKLKEKIVELTKASTIDEVRILQELAIYMERVDIAEEIVRLKGHIENFKNTLHSSESIGRKLDFIIQEMVRETNTIGSKSNDLSINERVIQIKVEIEKMREQVQNVE